ncbi:MAG: ferredoxin [Pyrinomonadaceae bacterium]
MKRHPLNAYGDFFVEYNSCVACDAPVAEARELMDYDADNHCYFKRQPQTPEELEHAISAVRVSCVEAVRYAGDDPEILAAIKNLPCKATSIEIDKTFSDKLKDGALKALRKLLNR